MRMRLLILAAAVAGLAGPALAEDAPVSTASQTTDQKISSWLSDGAPPSSVERSKDPPDDPLRDPADEQGDRKIHGEVGAAVGSGGYRSAYGVATIPIGKSSSATVAVSTSRGRYPWMAGAPWSAAPAGAGIRADCVCREAPDGSEQCRVGRAASRLDADVAESACLAPH